MTDKIPDKIIPLAEPRPEPVAPPNGAVPELKILPGLNPDDPFDPENVQLAGGEVLGAEKVVLTIPVRKPQSAEFFRVHPTLRIDTALLDHEREKFLIAPPLRGFVAEALPYSLLYCLNRNGGAFLWPIRLPGSDGRSNQWWDGARAAATYAKDRWVRCWANLTMNSYDAVIATAHIPEPNWPDLPLRDVLRLAFKDRLIDRHDHPILKALRGEV
jgi:hypothetical protein